MDSRDIDLLASCICATPQVVLGEAMMQSPDIVSTLQRVVSPALKVPAYR